MLSRSIEAACLTLRVASYRYNFRGECIAKTLYNSGSPVQTVHYHYDE